MGPSESHQKKASRKNPHMGLQAILMHNDSQKKIYYHNLILFFPICNRKDFKKISLLKKNLTFALRIGSICFSPL